MRLHILGACPAESLIRGKIQEARDQKDMADNARLRAAEAIDRMRRVEAACDVRIKEAERMRNDYARHAQRCEQRESQMREELRKAEEKLMRYAQGWNPWAREAQHLEDRKTKPLTPDVPAQRTQTPAGAVEGEATVPAGHHEATA